MAPRTTCRLPVQNWHVSKYMPDGVNSCRRRALLLSQFARSHVTPAKANDNCKPQAAAGNDKNMDKLASCFLHRSPARLRQAALLGQHACAVHGYRRHSTRLRKSYKLRRHNMTGSCNIEKVKNHISSPEAWYTNASQDGNGTQHHQP